MQEERKRILDMVENGTITAQEALELLEALGKTTTTATPTVNEEMHQEQKTYGKSSSKQQNPDFVEEIKRDFTVIGERFMQFMQGTVDKLKDFEFDVKITDPIVFEEKFVKEDAEFEDISINIANGKVEIIPTDESHTSAVVKAKCYRGANETEAKARFHEEFIFTTEANKLRVYSDMKTISAHVVLFVPKKSYNHISARLFNGDFTAKNLELNTLKVRTTNGKVDLDELTFKRADIETGNGTVQVQRVKGDSIEVETMNGRIYVDGKLKEIEGSSVSGQVILTTKDKDARKIEGTAVAGTVELYVPKNVSIKGEVTTQLGKIDVQLADVTKWNETEQLLYRKIGFTKITDSEADPLRVYGDAKTGSVLVRYTIEGE